MHSRNLSNSIGKVHTLATAHERRWKGESNEKVGRRGGGWRGKHKIGATTHMTTTKPATTFAAAQKGVIKGDPT